MIGYISSYFLPGRSSIYQYIDEIKSDDIAKRINDYLNSQPKEEKNHNFRVVVIKNEILAVITSIVKAYNNDNNSQHEAIENVLNFLHDFIVTLCFLNFDRNTLIKHSNTKAELAELMDKFEENLKNACNLGLNPEIIKNLNNLQHLWTCYKTYLAVNSLWPDSFLLVCNQNIQNLLTDIPNAITTFEVQVKKKDHCTIIKASHSASNDTYIKDFINKINSVTVF